MNHNSRANSARGGDVVSAAAAGSPAHQQQATAPQAALRDQLSAALATAGAQPWAADLLAWGRRYLPPHFAAPAPSAMHRWLAGELAEFPRRGRKVNLIGPRGSAKSTVGTLAYVLQAAVAGSERYIWIVSDTRHQAQTHLDNIKAELVDNPLLARDYARAVGRGPRWQAASIELANGVVIESFGTGQRIRGRRRRADRPTLIVCDDLQNDQHISSAPQRELSRRWFHGTLLPAGTKTTNVLHLATALHREALAVELLATAGWRSARFPAISAWPTNLERWHEWEAIYTNVENVAASDEARDFFEAHRAEMEAGAAVLWPEVEDLYTLMRLRVECGRTAFEREKQGAPIAPELCEWPEAYFDEAIWFDEWPAELAIRTVALDPSKGGDSRRGDYSAYALVGVDPAGLVFVEADLARRPTPQMVADGARLCGRFRPHVFGVEVNQYQELLAGEIHAEFARHRLGHLAVAGIHNSVRKQLRIRRLGPYLSQRRLRFLRSSPTTRLLVDQLRDFPAGAHDDGPDALEMAIRLAEDLLVGRAQHDRLGDRLRSAADMP